VYNTAGKSTMRLMPLSFPNQKVASESVS